MYSQGMEITREDLLTDMQTMFDDRDASEAEVEIDTKTGIITVMDDSGTVKRFKLIEL